nr:aminotransferase class III-fold pyridoxal phosphate-dependent enzyme [Gammaproteobacteria bacterium]
MKNENFLKENNGRLMWHPMTSPQDSVDNPPKIIVESSGVSVTDIDGHTVVDAVGGLWNVNLGYSCQPVKDAITHQLSKLPYYSTFRGTSNDAAIELSYVLSEFFKPDGMSRSFFTSGGSDSVETSLRLARQYHKLRGEPGRVKFLSLKKGYHGTHTGGASVNGNANFRTAYEPLLPGCFHIPSPYTYRNPFNETNSEALAQNCVSALEDEIAFQGANTIAAMIMEPILGAGGVIPPHKSFAPMVKEVCERNGILLITDEVITAYGRTGAWSGARLWGIQPDMMCTAKAITNGYFPFGAVMLGEKLVECFENNPEARIGHGYTYSGHPVGAAAALACLAETERLNVIENAAARGAQLYQGCLKLKDKYDVVGDVRGGYGLMTAIE